MKCCSLIERFLLIFQVPCDRCPRSHWGNGSWLHCELMKETDLGLPEGVILRGDLKRDSTAQVWQPIRNASHAFTHTNTQMRDKTHKGRSCTGHLCRFDTAAREKCRRCLEHLNGSSKHSCVPIRCYWAAVEVLFCRLRVKVFLWTSGASFFVFRFLMPLS